MNAPDRLSDRAAASVLQRQLARYRAVRRQTVALCGSLSPEDCQAQSMPDASPAKWHLAHTTWFFETFVLGEFAPTYTPAFAAYRVLFNSYYNAVGEKHPRAQRGLLTRPTLAEVLAYRAAVDDAIVALISSGVGEFDRMAHFERMLTLGLHHEQQHQELILTDVKHLLSCNPLGPAYCTPREGMLPAPGKPPGAALFRRFDGGVVLIGHQGSGFSFDNEGPVHKVLLQPFELADRLVTCGEYRAFVEAGGYTRPDLWLSLGWDRIQAEGWRLPLYWRYAAAPAAQPGDSLEQFTLHGWQPLDPAAPVAHLSFFEADAYARWCDARLPTEAEWEHAARLHFESARACGVESSEVQADGPAESGQAIDIPQEANLLESGALRPLPPAVAGDARLKQLWGDLWEWTASAYLPYPGFRTCAGAVGEYNGKFMCNQYVLRGGSFATPRDHIRPSYRNFFPPEARWQFTGLRLARDADRCAMDCRLD